MNESEINERDENHRAFLAEIIEENEEELNEFGLSVLLNNESKVRQLLKKGADPNTIVHHIPFLKDGASLIPIFVAYGLDVNIIMDEYGYSILIFCCEQLNLSSAAYLLLAGADVHYKKNNGVNALTTVLDEISTDTETASRLIDLLLDYGAHLPEDINSFAHVPLLNAELRDRIDNIKAGTDRKYFSGLGELGRNHLQRVMKLDAHSNRDCELYWEQNNTVNNAIEGLTQNERKVVIEILEPGERKMFEVCDDPDLHRESIQDEIDEMQRGLYSRYGKSQESSSKSK